MKLVSHHSYKQDVSKKILAFFFGKVSTCIIRTPCIRIDDVLHFSFSSMCVYSGVAVVVKGSRVHRKAGPGAGKSRGSILMRNTVSYSARDLKYWEVNEAVPLLLVFLSF